SLYLSTQYTLFYTCFRNHQDLHSFPTRRSSDLRRCPVYTHATYKKRKSIEQRSNHLIRHTKNYCCIISHRYNFYNLSILQKINRSEEHTSELQSRFDLVCRLLLEKKKK